MDKRRLILLFFLLLVSVLFVGCSTPMSNVNDLSDEAAINKLIEKFSRAVVDDEGAVIESCFVTGEIILAENNEVNTISSEDLSEEFYGQYKKYDVSKKVSDVGSTSATYRGDLSVTYTDSQEEEFVVEFGLKKDSGKWLIDKMRKSPANPGGGLITVIVEVRGVDPGDLPIKVTLLREEVKNTVETVNSDGVTTATFKSEASGDCFLYGEDVRGYTCEYTEEFPMPVKLIGRQKIYDDFVLVYDGPKEVKATSISIDEGPGEVIKGYPQQYTATIHPLNASEREITWSSSDESIASVDAEGSVSGLASGTVTLTSSINEGEQTLSDTCTVDIISIESLENPPDIDAFKEQLVLLDEELLAQLDNGTATYVPVIWYYNGVVVEPDFTVPAPADPECLEYELQLEARAAGFAGYAVQKIRVTNQQANAVTGVSLNQYSCSVYMEVDPDQDYTYQCQLEATVLPENASTKDVIWYSSNEGVAAVDGTGLVTGIAPGTANVTVETVDGGYTATCMVSVMAVPEIEYLIPVDIDGEPAENFETPVDTYIDIANLIPELDFNRRPETDEFGNKFITFYLRIEEKGMVEPLGEGEVRVYTDGVVKESDERGIDTEMATFFNLYSRTEFDIPSSYSARCFLKMSDDETFPMGDDEETGLPYTFMVNFIIDSQVPTVPEEDIHVYLDMIGGTNTGEDVIFLLCRETEGELEDITWDDYLDLEYIEYVEGRDVSYYTDDPYDPDKDLELEDFPFTDEVKVKGKTSKQIIDGLECLKVDWSVPKETIKIGGYFLLEVTPNDYEDNLNNANPAEDEGTFKEVHLDRDQIFERTITNTYTGL